MSKIKEYSDVEIAEIAFGALLPERNRLLAMELQQAGPSKLIPGHNWVSKALEELEKEGLDSEGHWTPNIDFNGDPKFACHFKTKLSDETKTKLLNAINDMLEHRSQDLFKPPYFIEVTEGDDINHVKVHIVFDSFNGIEPGNKKGNKTNDT